MIGPEGLHDRGSTIAEPVGRRTYHGACCAAAKAAGATAAEVDGGHRLLHGLPARGGAGGGRLRPRLHSRVVRRPGPDALPAPAGAEGVLPARGGGGPPRRRAHAAGASDSAPRRAVRKRFRRGPRGSPRADADPEHRERLAHHYAYWREKWGFDLLNPDMDAVCSAGATPRSAGATTPTARRAGEEIVGALVGVSVAVPVISTDEGELLRHALPTALAQEDVEVVVIDNASSDSTAAVAAELGVRCVRLDERHSLAAGDERRAAQRGRRPVLFMQPDCFLAPGFVAAARRRLDEPGVGSVAPKLVRTAGPRPEQRLDAIDAAGMSLDRRRKNGLVGHGRPALAFAAPPRPSAPTARWPCTAARRWTTPRSTARWSTSSWQAVGLGRRPGLARCGCWAGAASTSRRRPPTTCAPSAPRPAAGCRTGTGWCSSATAT